MITGIGEHKASSKILNTNLGVGFTKGRKYDTDLDRLGRMKTSHEELRKIGDLRTELRQMNRELNMGMNRKIFSIRRFSSIRQKEFGIGDMASGVVNGVTNGVREATGSAVESSGKLLDSGLGKTAGTIAGIGNMGTGASVGATLGSALGPLGSVVGGAVGALAAPAVTSKIVSSAGKGLKQMGKEIRPGEAQ